MTIKLQNKLEKEWSFKLTLPFYYSQCYRRFECLCWKAIKNYWFNNSIQIFAFNCKISCLLATTKAEMNEESEADDSSLEIYLALTEQLSEEDLAKQKLRLLQEKQAQQLQKQQMAIMPRRPNQQQLVKIRPIEKPPVLTDITDEVEPTVTFFDNMVKEFQRKEAFVRGASEDGEILDDLIRVEEIFIATMLAKCLKLCPSAFENEITKEEIMNLINRASRFLWTSVGGTLEHYLLWWAQFPLACKLNQIKHKIINLYTLKSTTQVVQRAAQNIYVNI